MGHHGPSWGVCIHLDIFGDSSTVVNWVNGAAKCAAPHHRDRIQVIQSTLYSIWANKQVRTAEVGGVWMRHVIREHNALADTMANDIMNKRCRSDIDCFDLEPNLTRAIRLRASFDGGCRSLCAAAAWINKADELAKLGAGRHGLTATDYWVLLQVATEGAKWVGDQEVLRSRWQWCDAPELFCEAESDTQNQKNTENWAMRPLDVSFFFRGCLPMRPIIERAEADSACLPQLHDHKLVIGDVVKPWPNTFKVARCLICCLKCGAYAQWKPENLPRDCDLNILEAGLSRIKRGLYPATHRRYANWRVSNLRVASASQVDWLLRDPKMQPAPISWHQPLANRWNQKLLFLAQYGLSEADLAM